MDEDYRRIINERRQSNLNKQREFARKRLKDDVRKKLTTTMIGAIATFENNFGHLWGIEKNEKDLTPEEKEYDEAWQATRKEIMDKGHIQIAAISDELDNYTVEWNRYQFQIIFRNKD